MKKTTLYLPDELKQGIERLAHDRELSEAEVIRDAITVALRGKGAPAPRVPLTKKGLGRPDIADNADSFLEDFGT